MSNNQALTWLDGHARTVDRECLAQDHHRKVELLHRQWHAESVFSSCDDDCLFVTGEESKSCSGLLPGDSDETGWSPTTPEGDRLRLRSGRTDHYFQYIELLTVWGAPFGLDASQVGDRNYGLIRDDGEQRAFAA